MTSLKFISAQAIRIKRQGFGEDRKAVKFGFFIKMDSGNIHSRVANIRYVF